MPDHPASREPELLTITEAAELLRAPVATLRYWRHLGTGPRSFRLGRRILYRTTTCEAGSTPSTARSPTTRGAGGEPASPQAHSPGCRRHLTVARKTYGAATPRWRPASSTSLRVRRRTVRARNGHATGVAAPDARRRSSAVSADRWSGAEGVGFEPTMGVTP